MHTYIGVSANTAIRFHIEQIDKDSSYPLLDKIVPRIANIFEIDYTLLHTLGAQLEFKK